MLKNADGFSYLVRQGDTEKIYPSGRHAFLFNGLVQGYVLPDEKLPFQVIQRLVPDGEYTVVVAADTGRKNAQIEGLLAVDHKFLALPTLSEFSINPGRISPNRDGIHDTAIVTLHLPQDVHQLSVYAISPGEDAYPIPEEYGLAPLNAAGNHTYRFDALEVMGEQLMEGQFMVIADAYDVFEQHIRWQLPLEVTGVGEVAGFILDGAVTYSGDVVGLNDTLCFSLTVLNNGDGYMRTIGPWSATQYQDTMNFTTKKYPEDKGAFRIGLDLESSDGQYPFRWALGTPGVDLVQLEDGWYLPPRRTGTVTGCVRFSVMPKVNPQYAWVGLIHEQSDLQLVNHSVAPHLVKVVPETR
ncbi:MAG: hypothetical protein E4H27_06450 [Anaerolineales bacterium]|nr:MAG: hypothetical protein E4H27_06450 [Anaerolineales bacterium]